MEAAWKQPFSGSSIVRHRSVRFGVAGVFAVLCLYLVISYGSPAGVTLRFPQSSVTELDEIPPKIWQIYTFANTKIEDFVPFLQSWITQNQDYAYTLLSNDGADAFAREHYADRPEVLNPFLNLNFPILRTDLLRYMILETKGGVYSDLDTGVRKPVRDWVPPELKSKVHGIVGIEYDQLDNEPYPGMSERLQFCQWTIAASRGHPLMRRIVQDVISALHSMAERYQTSISDLKPTDDEVVNVTGPVIWTRAVMQTLSEATGTTVDYQNLTGMTEPQLIGDVLILPIDGFGTGQPHSNSKTDESGDAYVRHMWKGSWKHGWGG